MKKFSIFNQYNTNLFFIFILFFSLILHLTSFTVFPPMVEDEATVLETGRIGCIKNMEDGCCYIPKDFDMNIYCVVRGGTRLYWKMFEIWRFLPRLFSILILHLSCFLLYAFLNKIFKDKKISLLCSSVFLFDPALIATVRMARCDIVSIALFFCIILLLNKCGELHILDKKRLFFWIAAVSVASILPFWWITAGFYVIPIVVYAIYINKDVFFRKKPHCTVDLRNTALYLFSAIICVVVICYLCILFLLESQPPINFVSEVAKTLSGEKYLDLSYLSRFFCYIRIGVQNYGAYLLPWLLSMFFIKKTWLYFFPFAIFVIIGIFTTPIYYARMAYILPCAILSLAALLNAIPQSKRILLFLIILPGLFVSFRYSIAGRTYKGIFKKQKYTKQYLFAAFKSIPIDKTILSDNTEKTFSLYEIGYKYHWTMYAYRGGGDTQELIAKYKIQWAVLPTDEKSSKIEMLKQNNFKLLKTIDAPIVCGEENVNDSWQIWYREL